MENNNKKGGVSFFGLLTVVFIALKLTGDITWSWWWVLAPLWGTWALAAILVFLVMIYAMYKEWTS